MAGFLRLPKTRWGAFAGHLVISAGIFAALFAVIAWLLFPGALFWVAGGVEGIRIIAGVDVVLGPMLTLVIYNIAKPRRELYRDLAIIGTIQALALTAGMSIVYASRPVAVAWVYSGFQTAKAGEFEEAGTEPLDGFSALTPTWWVVELPEDDAQARQAVALGELSGDPLRLRTELYLPLPEEPQAVRRAMRERGDADEREGCLMVDITTAFDARRVCFDPVRRRLSL